MSALTTLTTLAARYGVRLSLVVLLLLLVPAAAAQFIPRPQWTEGDIWEFPTASGGRLQLRVVGLENVTDGNVTMRAWRVSTTERMTDGTLVGRGEVWYGESDHARLRETTADPGEGPRTLNYDHGCIETPFPLRLGARWNVTCQGSLASTGARFTLRYDASVSAVENTSVPVGTFATLVVERNLSSGPAREHWSSDACHWVRKESAQGTIELAAFKCQATRLGVPPAPTAPPTAASAPTPPPAPAPTPGPSLALVVAAAVVALVARRKAS